MSNDEQVSASPAPVVGGGEGSSQSQPVAVSNDRLQTPGSGGWRPEVRAFADLMERELRANDHKPGWKSESVGPLIDRLREEVDEMHTEVDLGDAPGSAAWCRRVGSEAADVANFAMMIADVCGALSTLDATPNPAPEIRNALRLALEFVGAEVARRYEHRDTDLAGFTKAEEVADAVISALKIAEGM